MPAAPAVPSGTDTISAVLMLVSASRHLPARQRVELVRSVLDDVPADLLAVALADFGLVYVERTATHLGVTVDELLVRIGAVHADRVAQTS